MHMTSYFDAGDIDKFNNSPVARNNCIYHAKKRFKSPDVNMHYSQTTHAVGVSSGDRDLDKMRFQTTNQMEHNETKVRFGEKNANPPNIYETMAKQSRLRLNSDGKPRSLLAHEDYSKGTMGY